MDLFKKKRITGKDVLRAAFKWKKTCAYSSSTEEFLKVLNEYQDQAVTTQVEDEIFEEDQ